jgi:probable F420-dependent oxidoreductase
MVTSDGIVCVFAMAVEFGVLLPTREAIMSGRPETAPLLTMAERAEAAGFDSVWIGDSLTARPRHEPLTLLAAVAGRTRRVRLGTGVLLPALRNPVVLAHVVATLDRVAEGRVILGVGIAADMPAIRKEFAAAGVPFERRVGRFLETLEICRALWTRDNVSFSGKHFTLEGATVEPKPHRPGGPPIWIGGSGPTAFREAPRFDAWFPTGPSVEFFAEHWPRIQAAARAAGRAADAVTGAAYVTLALDPSPAAAEQRLHQFLESYYAAPARAILARQACYAGPIEGCVEWLQRWLAAGARHLMFRFAGGDQLAQVDEAASKLLPRLKRG